MVDSLDLREGPPPALLMGRHVLALGMSPGPQVGHVLKLVYDLQMEGSVTTLEEAKTAAMTLMGMGMYGID